MYKVIDLGAQVPETGEARVQLLDTSLVKTAGTVIQDYWDTLEKSDKYAYLWVISVSAQEYYGCNNNGDAFAEEDLKKCHTDFVTNAHIFLHHVNKDPKKSIGKPVFSWYNEPMHRIELILAVDKQNPMAAETLMKLEAGQQLYVSMGTHVAYDVCSICGNKAPTRAQYCDHLRYNMKKILDDGRQVFAHNPNPKFFDISIVNKPADPTAFALDKIAGDTEDQVIPSAALGEKTEMFQCKQAAVLKLADLVKRVDGVLVDSKSTSPVRQAVESNFAGFDWPVMPYDSLDNAGISPAGFIGSMLHLGSPLSIQDIVWMVCRSMFGGLPSCDFMRHTIHTLPRAMSMLCDDPSRIDSMAAPVLSEYNHELEDPAHRMMIIRIIKPTAVRRITIIGGQEKDASMYGVPEARYHQYGSTITEKVINTIDSDTPNFGTVTFRDEFGHTVKTTPYHMRQAAVGKFMDRLPARVLGAALTTGAIASLFGTSQMSSNMLRSALLGIPGISLLLGSMAGKVDTSTAGDTLERKALVAGYKQHVKQAADLFQHGVDQLSKGIADPAVFSLDYAYGYSR